MLSCLLFLLLIDLYKPVCNFPFVVVLQVCRDMAYGDRCVHAKLDFNIKLLLRMVHPPRFSHEVEQETTYKS
jgi:hypothetical protein